jgi:Zn-dependent protease
MDLGGRRWKIGSIRGVPIYVGVSWVFVAALYVWATYLRLGGGSTMSSTEAVLLAVVATGLFFGSVLVHEAAHAVTARRLELPVFGITLVFWGGATETTASLRGPKGEFLVAFAGPASTLVLAGVFWILAQQASGTAFEILDNLAGLNLLLAGLNALPGFPLDGGRMLMAAVWGATGNRETGMRAAGYGAIVVGGLMLAFAAWSFMRVPGGGYGLFLGFLGFVLISTGRGMERRVQLRGLLQRGTVADAMRPAPPPVPATSSLVQALDGSLGADRDRLFPVTDGGRVVGAVSFASARKVGGRDPLRPVADGMLPLSQIPMLTPELGLDDAVEAMGSRSALVMREGDLLGAIDPADVEAWYRRVIEGRHDDADADPPARLDDRLARQLADTDSTAWVPPRPDA